MPQTDPKNTREQKSPSWWIHGTTQCPAELLCGISLLLLWCFVLLRTTLYALTDCLRTCIQTNSRCQCYTGGASLWSLIVQQLCQCKMLYAPVPHRVMSQITLPLWLLALFYFTFPTHPSPIYHSLYDFVSSVLIAWGLIGPVLTGLVVMVGAGGGFSSTFSGQVPGGSLSVSGLLVSLSTLWAFPPICLFCCCSEKNRCVDWRTSALCFANT